VRLSDVEINPDTLKLEIDALRCNGSFVVIVCNGKARLTNLPTFGETNIVTHDGLVKRVKFNEGEVF
jgi:hypothetical protein